MIDKLDGRTPATTPVLPPNTNLDTSADGSVITQSSQGSNGSTTGINNSLLRFHENFANKLFSKKLCAINHTYSITVGQKI